MCCSELFQYVQQSTGSLFLSFSARSWQVSGQYYYFTWNPKPVSLLYRFDIHTVMNLSCICRYEIHSFIYLPHCHYVLGMLKFGCHWFGSLGIHSSEHMSHPSWTETEWNASCIKHSIGGFLHACVWKCLTGPTGNITILTLSLIMPGVCQHTIPDRVIAENKLWFSGVRLCSTTFRHTY